MEIISESERDTELLGEKLAKLLSAGTVLALYGGLGSGKTALVRGLASGLGLEDRVYSPTFTIVNEYSDRLFHFDMYRLSSADELFELGWEDYLKRGGICAVEWSENIEDAFDGSEVTVTFYRTEKENARRIVIQNLKTEADFN